MCFLYIKKAKTLWNSIKHRQKRGGALCYVARGEWGLGRYFLSLDTLPTPPWCPKGTWRIFRAAKNDSSPLETLLRCNEEALPWFVPSCTLGGKPFFSLVCSFILVGWCALGASVPRCVHTSSDLFLGLEPLPSHREHKWSSSELSSCKTNHLPTISHLALVQSASTIKGLTCICRKYARLMYFTTFYSWHNISYV